ncbi:MAG: glycosyltransferase family 2 protein, partial [Oscillospiraceae bacterium]
MSALVSIIIPIYNAAPQLARCIESVRRQTYQNLEIILVNDGSHDASLPICRMYADVDKRIVIIDKLNSGVSATRNIAIDDARGAYLQFVDADDYLVPNATEIMVTRAMEASADMVIANYYRVDGDEITEHG